jgi:hypothetical protein
MTISKERTLIFSVSAKTFHAFTRTILASDAIKNNEFSFKHIIFFNDLILLKIHPLSDIKPVPLKRLLIESSISLAQETLESVNEYLASMHDRVTTTSEITIILEKLFSCRRLCNYNSITIQSEDSL